MMLHKKPDFLVVGAAKSGTTSVFNYLTQHPDIFIPDIKECRFFSQLDKNFIGLGAEFFANEGVDEQEYFSLFDGKESKVCGDISNDYLYYYSESIKNIKKYLDPNVKIVIILRNPVDRAYSNYMHHVRDGWENLSFEDAIKQEEQRIAENWGWSYHYVNVGMYLQQVSAYLENFDHVKIYTLDDLKDRDFFLADLFNFLGVRNVPCHSNRELYNVSGLPKSFLIHRFLNDNNTLRRWVRFLVGPMSNWKFIQKMVAKVNVINLQKTPITPSTEFELKKIYRDNVVKLSNLIDRDLSGWIK